MIQNSGVRVEVVVLQIWVADKLTDVDIHPTEIVTESITRKFIARSRRYIPFASCWAINERSRIPVVREGK